ncbi:hypothetical protein [Herbaspirillum rubrisubalbicans]|uniref:hypothetical protein n=1 Tax=Herbaspirillum rubrisubalbicans TaxID=80842 RepID=UPI00037E60CE|nr:hypothetical protein [Herbaspirillum rubrisubalbicans]
MSLIHKCANGKLALISDKNNIFHDIEESRISPSIVLITAWIEGVVQSESWAFLVERMLRSGCTYFVCAGTYAENLHDLIDEEIYSLNWPHPIITTYHTDEAPEDIANFLVNAIDISNKEDNGVAAVLDVAILGDKLLKKSLLNM